MENRKNIFENNDWKLTFDVFWSIPDHFGPILDISKSWLWNWRKRPLTRNIYRSPFGNLREPFSLPIPFGRIGYPIPYLSRFGAKMGSNMPLLLFGEYLLCALWRRLFWAGRGGRRPPRAPPELGSQGSWGSQKGLLRVPQKCFPWGLFFGL